MTTKIILLARSMVTTGYCQDEPISSRIFDLSAPDGILVGKLLFGDGQARGLAVRSLSIWRASHHIAYWVTQN